MKVFPKIISKLISQVEPEFLVTTIIVSLLITSTLFYIFKEQERSLRIFTRERLAETIEEKYKAEERLRGTVIVKKKLEEELEQKNRLINLALNKLEEEISARRKAEAQLLTALKEIRNSEERLQDITQKPGIIELEQIVVTSQPLLSGEISSVNEEYRFILVNLGRADGLSIGDILSVYRNGKFIGKAEVERLEERTAACAILPAWEKQEFKEKDLVKRP